MNPMKNVVMFMVVMLPKNVSAKTGLRNSMLEILILKVLLGQEDPLKLVTTKL